MFLVLCHAADDSAVATFHAIRRRRSAQVEIVSVEALCAGLSWEFRMGADATRARVRLADGRALDADRIEGALNRTAFVAPVGVEQASEEEAEYAREEFTAFVLGWLAALRNVVNAATPSGLSGRHATPLEWTWRARQAGLPIAVRFEATPRAAPRPGEAAAEPVHEWAYVVGDRVVGAEEVDALAEGCVTLARDAGAGVLGVGFVREPGGLAFATATPTPHLPAHDERFVDALAARLGMPPHA